MTSSRLEYLKYEKNRLVDLWKSKKFTNEARILVRIMDLEEDIADEQLRLRKKAQNQKSIAV